MLVTRAGYSSLLFFSYIEQNWISCLHLTFSNLVVVHIPSHNFSLLYIFTLLKKNIESFYIQFFNQAKKKKKE